jgi:hypothetical protein
MRSSLCLCASTGNINPWLGKHVPAPMITHATTEVMDSIFSMCPMLYHILNMYEGEPKNYRNRPVANACFLVTSCAAR